LDTKELIRFSPEEINPTPNGTPDPSDIDRYTETEDLSFKVLATIFRIFKAIFRPIPEVASCNQPASAIL
jgi:hypothetical protein